jgi:SNF2 family DNA or RNA helicase
MLALPRLASHLEYGHLFPQEPAGARQLVLREPQVPMVDWLHAHKRCGLWAGMGIGKTSATMFVLDQLMQRGEVDRRNPTLVIGPMRVARDTWPEEANKWKQLQPLRIVPIVGTPQQRAGTLHQSADIFTISYELAPWLVEQWLDKWPYRIVIADESDRLKGYREKGGKKSTSAGVGNNRAGKSGKRAHSLSRIAHNLTDRWINLTGTPASAGLKDLWGQTWYLDRGQRLGYTYTAFKDRWFRQKWSGFGIEPMPNAIKEIPGQIRDLYLTVDPKDYFDLQEPIYQRLTFDLPARAASIYKRLEDESYAEIEELGAKINAVNAAALTQKLLQAANGAVYTERPEWVELHQCKLEILDSIVSEASGSPLLVSYAFQSDRARILKWFGKQAVGIDTPQGLKAFKSGNVRVGVAHPKSMGHGIDGLQNVCNKIAFFGHDWKTGERMQIIERVGAMRQFQIGRTDGMFIYDIVARGTEDENAMKVHHENASVQDVVLNHMNRRRT